MRRRTDKIAEPGLFQWAAGENVYHVFFFELGATRGHSAAPLNMRSPARRCKSSFDLQFLRVLIRLAAYFSKGKNIVVNEACSFLDLASRIFAADVLHNLASRALVFVPYREDR